MCAESATEAASVRIEALLEEVHATASEPLAQRVEELVETIVGLYGQGLERIVGALTDSQVGSVGAWARLREDPLVSALLLLHGLHPDDVRTRVEDALVRIQPDLASHAGGVTLLGVDRHGVVRLRLEGTCGGCAASAAMATRLIEQAVREAAPETTRVDVEDLPAAPALPQSSPVTAPAVDYVRESPQKRRR